MLGTEEYILLNEKGYSAVSVTSDLLCFIMESINLVDLQSAVRSDVLIVVFIEDHGQKFFDSSVLQNKWKAKMSLVFLVIHKMILSVRSNCVTIPNHQFCDPSQP